MSCIPVDIRNAMKDHMYFKITVETYNNILSRYYDSTFQSGRIISLTTALDPSSSVGSRARMVARALESDQS